MLDSVIFFLAADSENKGIDAQDMMVSIVNTVLTDRIVNV